MMKPEEIEIRIRACTASRGFMMPHTCGLESLMYFQGEPHFHNGLSCIDWAHCSQTSDQQREIR